LLETLTGATERGVVLGQVATAEHSSMSTALPVLLQVLNVPGATGTSDARGCQKEIAQQLWEQGGDYVRAVKGNHKSLEEAIDFQRGPGHSNVPPSQRTTSETNPGRTDKRT
jgi:predicted transposase YbfD/YdcC